MHWKLLGGTIANRLQYATSLHLEEEKTCWNFRYLTVDGVVERQISYFFLGEKCSWFGDHDRPCRVLTFVIVCLDYSVYLRHCTTARSSTRKRSSVKSTKAACDRLCNARSVPRPPSPIMVHLYEAPPSSWRLFPAPASAASVTSASASSPPASGSHTPRGSRCRRHGPLLLPISKPVPETPSTVFVSPVKNVVLRIELGYAPPLSIP